MASRDLWPGLWHPCWRLFHSRAATKGHSCKERIALSLACLFQARAPSATAFLFINTMHHLHRPDAKGTCVHTTYHWAMRAMVKNNEAPTCRQMAPMRMYTCARC